MVKATSTSDNIWVAAGDGQLDRVKMLLEEGVDPNGKDEFGYTPIHAAVSYNQKEVLEYLLNHGGDINVEDSDKDTPLYVCESVDMAKFMLDRGASAEHKNDEGISPAQNAWDEGWKDVAQLLADITHETLDTEDEALAAAVAETSSLEATFADDGEADEAFAAQVEQVMMRIQDNGGVEDEEELRQIVTKMLLDQVKLSLGGTGNPDDAEPPASS
ncbi:ankyrin repeat-containing domain protein [Gongronella butleri]|nr:ankyrin repeat-containing domain protein [Gongronella butleri]